MKNIKFIRFLLIAVVTVSLLGCNLELQEGFTFTPDVNTEDPFAEISAWEFLQQNRQLTEEGELNGELFNYMAAAVEAAGMVEEYDGSNESRTYLFLTNSAFVNDDGEGIVELITASGEAVEGETPEQLMARADIDVLRLILRYHIVTSYIDQLTLAERGVNYTFQTLIPGENGIIIMRRDERYRIDINDEPAPLPSSATSESRRIRNYNYVVNNGIGHALNGPVRNQPYPEPN